LGAGTYTLWMEGTGSVLVAAVTAVGSGFATASAGSPVTITITIAGTVIVTPSGSVLRFQLNNGPVVLPYVLTTAATVTSTADAVTWPVASIAGGFPQTAGTAVVGWVPGYAVGVLPASTSANILGVTNGAGLLYASNVSSNGFKATDGTSVATTGALSWTASTLYYVAIKWNKSGQTINSLATAKMQIGYRTATSTTWTWGSAQTYTGTFALGSYVYLGYGTAYPHNITMASIYNTVLPDRTINAEIGRLTLSHSLMTAPSRSLTTTRAT
jgi:hypothetical protein